jgi:hypothetical protein
MSRCAIGLAAGVVFVVARLASDAETPSTDHVLGMLYPGGQITVDAEGRHVIRGGAHAVPSALRPRTTDKVVSRVTWFSARW